MAEALYRKYRPQIFEDVVGQEHIERTIKNAIAQDKLSHAYLFTGPRGTGKTTTARLLAKALLCEKGPTAEPDGTCADCQMIANGEHPDVYELDAASRTGVENVREEIIGRVQFAPTRGRYKIYIIDEVHMLSTAAFNALLKTLEEPPSHVVFILATTDPQKVPETIHSRCQRFDFRRISLEAIVSRLGAICVAEGVEFEGEALDLVAHRAEGGMRNALTSLEQLIAFGDGRVTLEVAERMLGSLDSGDLAEIVQYVGTRDVAACFRWTAQFVETGADLAQFTRDFAEHVRNMYVMSLAGADVALEVGEAARRELAEELRLFGPDRLARLLGVLGDLSAELKTSTNPRLSFEIALTRMVRPESDLTLEALAERIEALESLPLAPVEIVRDAAGASRGETGAVQRPADTAAVRESSTGAGSLAESAAAPFEQPIQDAQAPAEDSFREAVPPPTSCAGRNVAELRNPAALQRMWQAALSALKKEKAAYGVLFMNTKAMFDEAAEALVVEFPAENAFAFKTVQKPDIQSALEAALAKAHGAPLPFSFRSAAGGSGSAELPSSAAAAAASEPGTALEQRPLDAAASWVHEPASPVSASLGASASRGFEDSRAEAYAAAPAAASPAPELEPVPYDEVPLDAYDGFAAYDEVPLQAYEEPSFAPASDAAASVPVDDLQAILTQSFGAGVVFHEVND